MIPGATILMAVFLPKKNPRNDPPKSRCADIRRTLSAKYQKENALYFSLFYAPVYDRFQKESEGKILL